MRAAGEAGPAATPAWGAEAHGAFGISRGGFDVLATLRRSGEPYAPSPGRLPATPMPTSDGMTGRPEKPERAGLLGGSPDPHDRRAPRVTLSGRGRRILAGAVRREALEGALDGREAERLSGLLRKPLNATGA